MANDTRNTPADALSGASSAMWPGKMPDTSQTGGSVGIDYVNSLGGITAHCASDNMDSMKPNEAFNRVNGGTDNDTDEQLMVYASDVPGRSAGK